jgi:PrtD family type I secretion system ABC transporter
MPDWARPDLSQALGACRQHLVFVAAFSATMNILFLAPMLYMLQIYDRVVLSRSGSTLAFLTIAVLLALVAQAILDGLRSRLLVKASLRLDHELSTPLFAHALANSGINKDTIANQPMRYFDTVRQAVTGPAMIALCDLPWAPFYLAICFLLHPWLGVLTLLGVVAVSVVAVWNERQTRQPLQTAQEAAHGAYAAQEQILRRADIVRALGMGGGLMIRHSRARALMLSAQADASFAGGILQALSKFLRLSLQSLALGAGAALAIDDRISLGAVFAASFLVSRAMAPIDMVVSQWQSFVQARFAYGELKKLASAGGDTLARTILPDPLGQIYVEKLGLVHGERAALIDVSLTINAGTTVAVVGPSGAGKSTLLRLIAGAENGGSGTIRFDGADREDWDPDELAQHIGYLPQDVGLMAASIKENIARFLTEFAPKDRTIDKRVIQAAQRSGAHDLILQLPGGYNYMLGSDGRGVSAGQAQRIGLARAFFGNPRILILDEPNSQLDAEGEAVLLRVLSQMKEQGYTIVFSTHRAALLQLADKILVMREGKVGYFGERDAVIRRLRSASGRAKPKGRGDD